MQEVDHSIMASILKFGSFVQSTNEFGPALNYSTCIIESEINELKSLEYAEWFNSSNFVYVTSTKYVVHTVIRYTVTITVDYILFIMNFFVRMQKF